MQLAISYMRFKRNFHFPVIIEAKYDGARAWFTWDPSTQTVTAKSRHGTDWTEKLKELCRQLKTLCIRHDVKEMRIFDGEVIAQDLKWSSTMSEIRSERAQNNLTFRIFDCLKDSYDPRSLEERRNELEHILPSYDQTKKLMRVPAKLCYSHREIFEEYRKALDKNLEGIMVKRRESEYRSTRNGNWQKMKPFDIDRPNL